MFLFFRYPLLRAVRSVVRLLRSIAIVFVLWRIATKNDPAEIPRNKGQSACLNAQAEPAECSKHICFCKKSFLWILSFTDIQTLHSSCLCPPASVPVNGSFRWGRETSILDQLFSNLFLCWTFYWEFILSTHSTCFVIQQWCIASRLTPLGLGT